MVAVNRLRPIEARRALHALYADPDDTEQAFRVIGSLTGKSHLRLLRRFRRTAAGARILSEHRQISDLLNDRERMQGMPVGSLGATVHEFYEREQITAGGLAAAGDAAFADGPRRDLGDEYQTFSAHLRDLHDVFHVVTGYGRDLRGEVAVLAFTVPQTRNPGIAYLVGSVLFRAGPRSEIGRLIRKAFWRGLRAAWLPGQDWEQLLERPVDEVREELRVGPPPVYEAVRSAAAPPIPSEFQESNST